MKTTKFEERMGMVTEFDTIMDEKTDSQCIDYFIECEDQCKEKWTWRFASRESASVYSKEYQAVETLFEILGCQRGSQLIGKEVRLLISKVEGYDEELSGVANAEGQYIWIFGEGEKYSVEEVKALVEETDFRIG